MLTVATLMKHPFASARLLWRRSLSTQSYNQCSVASPDIELLYRQNLQKMSFATWSFQYEISFTCELQPSTIDPNYEVQLCQWQNLPCICFCLLQPWLSKTWRQRPGEGSGGWNSDSLNPFDLSWHYYHRVVDLSSTTVLKTCGQKLIVLTAMFQLGTKPIKLIRHFQTITDAKNTLFEYKIVYFSFIFRLSQKPSTPHIKQGTHKTASAYKQSGRRIRFTFLLRVWGRGGSTSTKWSSQNCHTQIKADALLAPCYTLAWKNSNWGALKALQWRKPFKIM